MLVAFRHLIVFQTRMGTGREMVVDHESEEVFDIQLFKLVDLGGQHKMRHGSGGREGAIRLLVQDLECAVMHNQ